MAIWSCAGVATRVEAIVKQWALRCKGMRDDGRARGIFAGVDLPSSRPWARRRHDSQIVTVAVGHAHDSWPSRGGYGHARVVVIVITPVTQEEREWGQRVGRPGWSRGEGRGKHDPHGTATPIFGKKKKRKKSVETENAAKECLCHTKPVIARQDRARDLQEGRNRKRTKSVSGPYKPVVARMPANGRVHAWC
ncbi:hypothetical protein F5148DRAFT_1152192 [Russula earlei]|uniref:Uncharacterized protein n=1 Tax=Russula earlei TaxID=71964 RepID=A0ACC0TY67_9AGAM|nr:hypothetical protein F5148DRAFT_1152192 [Russula earlei]